jgi:fatty acid desaturase
MSGKYPSQARACGPVSPWARDVSDTRARKVGSVVDESKVGRNRLGPVRFPLFYFLFFVISFPFHFQIPISNSKFIKLQIYSAQANTNVNMTSTIFNIIIHYFPCYLFREGVNSFIKSPPFLIFYFIFFYTLRSQV